ncbi:MAG: recombinase family protein [Geodermatophilaceae bacterium]|nr:recombinase family protein [Geodermatophilaceae bacterium]
MLACGIYVRISDDADGSGLGVARQLKDCTELATRKGWQVAETYCDNDVSATRGNAREEYQRMLGDIRNGRIGGLIVWDVDRLTRTPRELEDIIDLADRHGLQLACVGGELDLATPQGRLTARIKGSVARHETDQQSRRLKRKFLERAENGQPHSFAAYGYRRVDGKDVLVPEEAETVRRAARMLLGGQSLRSVVATFNSEGSVSPRGLRWASTTLRQVLLRDRNAGLRLHVGQVIGRGAWEPIYDVGTHDQVMALLTDPQRRSNRGAIRKHLLSGIARCSRAGCDGTMVVNPGRVGKDGKHQPPAYVCARCTRIRRKESDVDAVVEAVMIARLSQSDALMEVAVGDQETIRAAVAEIAQLEAKLARTADDYADDITTGEQFRRITGKLRLRLEQAKRSVAAAAPVRGLFDVIGSDAEDRWRAASLDVRRTLIEAFMSVTIDPLGPGRSFDPATVRIEWRT